MKNNGFRFDPETHTYWHGQKKLPSVTQILKAVGIHQPSAFTNEYDMWVGTASHKAIELYLKGTLDESTLDARLRPRLDAFKEFQAMTGFKAKDTEKPCYHEGVLVAGTPDIVGVFPDNTLAVIDEKSGSVRPSTAIQTAGYAFILREPRARRFGIQLKTNGKFSMIEFTDSFDSKIWMQALSIYSWLHNNGGIRT